MTAAKKAKELGAKNLQQVAQVYGCTPQNLSYKYNKEPKQFEIIVLGVVEILKRE